VLRIEVVKPVVYLPRTLFEDVVLDSISQARGLGGRGLCPHMAQFISEVLWPGK
jgi:hypothetical protein